MNLRATRQRKRRAAGLKPHERALLTGEAVPGMNPFAHSGLSRAAANGAILKARLALVERHADLIPEERVPILSRYMAAWRGELGPGEIRDPSRWWRATGVAASGRS